MINLPSGSVDVHNLERSEHFLIAPYDNNEQWRTAAEATADSKSKSELSI